MSSPLFSPSTRFWSLRNPWLLRLAGLTLAVFLVHVALLNKANVALNLSTPKPSLAFITRTIEAVVTPPVLEPSPTVVVKPPPIAKPKQKPRALKQPPPAPRPTTTSSDASVASAPVSSEPTSLDLSEPMPTADVAPQLEVSPTPDAVTDAAPPATDQSPAVFAALTSAKYTYKVDATRKNLIYKGAAELKWQQDGENYALNLSATASGLPIYNQNSAGRLATQGLQPTRFSDKRLFKSEVAAHFDYVLGKVIFSNNKSEAVLAAGAQDRISVIIQLAGLLAANPTQYPPNTTISLQTISADEAQPWLFTVNEPETLNLSEGQQIALRLTRNPRREFDQKIELWFAPALNYLPVRIRQTESNGDFFDAQFKTSEPLPNTVSP